MSKKRILVMADRLTVYAIERQNGFERHQPPDGPPWQERRRFWTDAILQGMARLEGLTPDPGWMKQFDRRLEAACGCPAVETLPTREQAVLIRGLSRYISALEIISIDRNEGRAVHQQYLLIDEICRLLGRELRCQNLSDYAGDFFTGHGEAVQRTIQDYRLQRLPPQYDPAPVDAL